MRKISGNLVWAKPITLSRAAKLLSRFSAVDNGSPASVSLYLHRASEAFNRLVVFHRKHTAMEPIAPVDSESGDTKKMSAVAREDEATQIATKDEQERGQRKDKKNKRKRKAEIDSDRKKRRTKGAAT